MTTNPPTDDELGKYQIDRDHEAANDAADAHSFPLLESERAFIDGFVEGRDSARRNDSEKWVITDGVEVFDIADASQTEFGLALQGTLERAAVAGLLADPEAKETGDDNPAGYPECPVCLSINYPGTSPQLLAWHDDCCTGRFPAVALAVPEQDTETELVTRDDLESQPINTVIECWYHEDSMLIIRGESETGNTNRRGGRDWLDIAGWADRIRVIYRPAAVPSVGTETPEATK